MAKRFLTYFGVPIPPWKEPKQTGGAISIRFVLTGNMISKKNNEQAVAVRRHARKFITDHAKDGKVTVSEAMEAIGMVYAKIRGNPLYLAFVEKTRPIILEQMQIWSSRLKHKGLIFPIDRAGITIRLYIKDRYRRDTLNAQQTIQDLLKDCGVITDDNDLIINPYTAASAKYYDELLENISVITLTLFIKQISSGPANA